MVDALQCAALVHPYLGVGGRPGLGTVIETVLGAPLDKTCQCSAWEDRPLSSAQRDYAALDAWCLVRLTEVVVDQLQCDSTSSVSVDSHADTILSLEGAWQRVQAIAAAVILDSSGGGENSLDAEEGDGSDFEGTKRGGVAYGRDGVVALGVKDVEHAIAAAEARHDSAVESAAGTVIRGDATADTGLGWGDMLQLQGYGAPPFAEFYLSVGQQVLVMPLQNASSNETPTAAVIVAAPKDEIGVWRVRIIDDNLTPEHQDQAWIPFTRLAPRRSRFGPVSSQAVPPMSRLPSLARGRATVQILDKRTVTAAQAARVLGVTPQQIGKSLAFLLCGEPLCIVLRGDDRVDRGQLAAQLGMVSKNERRKLTIASRNECVEIWGYPPGSMPPFGHRRPVRTIVDERLATTEGLLAVGGGSAYALVQLDAAALLTLSNAEVLPITKDLDSLCEAHGILSRRRPEAAAVGAGGGGEALQGRHGPLRGDATTVRSSSVDANGHRQLHDPSLPSSAGAGSDTDTASGARAGAKPREKRFAVSNEMFRLARWLRVIGVDAAGLPTGGRGKVLTDALLIAAQEGRILLTRDKKLASRKDCGASYFVGANSTEAQFKEVQAQFGLTFNDSAFMSRCAVCNSPGFNGPLDATEIVNVLHGSTVPPGVLETVAEFWECSNVSCAKIYWEGPKFASAHSKFSGLFPPEPPKKTVPHPARSENSGMGTVDGSADDRSARSEAANLTPKAKATMAAVARTKKRQEEKVETIASLHENGRAIR